MKDRYENLDEYIADLRAALSQNDGCANHHYNLGGSLCSARATLWRRKNRFSPRSAIRPILPKPMCSLAASVCSAAISRLPALQRGSGQLPRQVPRAVEQHRLCAFAARRARKGHQRPAKGFEMGCRIHSGDGDSRCCLLHERPVRREHQNQRKAIEKQPGSRPRGTICLSRGLKRAITTRPPNMPTRPSNSALMCAPNILKKSPPIATSSRAGGKNRGRELLQKASLPAPHAKMLTGGEVIRQEFLL